MKKQLIKLWCLGAMICLVLMTAVHAQDQNRGSYWDNPDQILNKIRDKADPSRDMTESRLDGLINTQNQSFGETNRITNTLDTLRNAMGPYIQWVVFIALSGAVILIIYNGFLITTSMGDDTAQKDAKARIQLIIKGVVIVTWAYFVIKLLLAAITYVLS